MIRFRSLITSRAGRDLIVKQLRRARLARLYGRYPTHRQMLLEAKSNIHFDKLEASYRHQQTGEGRYACKVRHASLAEHALSLAYAQLSGSVPLPPGFTTILED